MRICVCLCVCVYVFICLMAAKKTNCVLAMNERNIKCKNAAIIMRLYKSLMRPRLEYCIQAWSPYHKKDIEVLERVQKLSYKNGLLVWGLKL